MHPLRRFPVCRIGLQLQLGVDPAYDQHAIFGFDFADRLGS
jgi:hypothetical protein